MRSLFLSLSRLRGQGEDITKHFCARGRIALSGVDLRPPGPGGGSKRTSFRELRRLNPRKPGKSRKTRQNGGFVNPDGPPPPCRCRYFRANRAMNLTRRRLLTVLAGAAAAVGVPSIWMSRMKTYDGPVSDHFDGLQFFDPDGVPPKSLGEALRWQFGGDRERAIWPE